MEVLVWIGAALAALGLVGIVLSILRVRTARHEAAGDDDLRARLQAILPLNLGAFLVSALGLMMVVMGLILG